MTAKASLLLVCAKRRPSSRCRAGLKVGKFPFFPMKTRESAVHSAR
jgi:hypothetical protein